MIHRLLTVLFILLAAAPLVPDHARADVGPPAHLLVTERDDGLYTVQWRVPNALPARAVPEPLFPEACRPAGEREVATQPGGWLFTQDWRCEAGLAGQPVGLRYPFPDLALTTVIRVNLLSGDRFAHVLSPGDPPWRLPEGTAAPDLLGDARRAVTAGAAHVAGSWIHLVFLVVLGLLGGTCLPEGPGLPGALRTPFRVVTAFTLGQAVAVGAASFAPANPIGSLAEIGFGLAVALLAREALRPEPERRRLAAVAAVAGLIHGWSLGELVADRLGDDAPGLAAQLVAVLGMDAAHLAGGTAAVLLVGFLARGAAAVTVRRGLAYAGGTAGMALAFSLALAGAPAETRSATPDLQIAGAAGASGAATPGSRRVAPPAPNAAVQSFVTVEPFELRHEVMLRLAGLAEMLDLDPAGIVEPSAQPALTEQLGRFVLEATRVEVDGAAPEALRRRVDFMVVDDTGSLPRANPVPETVRDAVVGVIVAYPTEGMADEVTLTWDPWPEPAASIPSTVIDPEIVVSSTLTPTAPVLTWENALTEDPIPAVEAVAVEPATLPVPWLSLPLFVVALALPVIGWRKRRGGAAAAGARVLLAIAFVLGPLVETAVALPGSAGRTPSARQARRVLAGLLPNVYRALEYRREAVIYDRLAVSVTGETLTEVYLDQRRALELEERGGAQARVEAVEVLEAKEIQPRDEGFQVRAVWTVGGMVTHFGHRHFRQNRYDARVGVVPVEGTWKIRSIEVLEQDRVR